MLDLTRIENESRVPGISALGQENIGRLINYLLPRFFIIAGLVLLLYVVWGGFTLMASQGDSKAVESAKNKITHGLVGFGIIFVAYWLVQLLGLVFGINQIQTIFP